MKILITALLILGFSCAYATEDCTDPHNQCGHSDDDNIEQAQDQVQNQEQIQEQENYQSLDNDQYVSVRTQYAKRAPNSYLVMQNQVEACGRTFGLSGSNTSGGWTFGVPIPRSWTPTCDLWKAAEEAQQNGHIYTSYMFQCSIKVIRKAWGEEACIEFDRRSMIELGLAPPEETVSDNVVVLAVEEYDELLIAQVQQEEFEEQQQIVEDRFAQYDNLIQAQQKEIDAHTDEQEEIEQLKIEAAKLRAAEEEAAARRAVVRDRYAKKAEEVEEEGIDNET